MSAQWQEISPQFRQMQLADLDAVMAIERVVYPYPWTLGNFRDSISAAYECWVLQADEKFVGYGVMMPGPGEAHLLNLSIASAWQRQGWGGKLLHYFFGIAEQRHARMIFLEVRASNIGAIWLYEKNGFTQIALRKNYYPADSGREDAVIMERPL